MLLKKKTGGPRRSKASFKPFSEMLQCCEMEEFSSKGDRFTWGAMALEEVDSVLLG